MSESVIAYLSTADVADRLKVSTKTVHLCVAHKGLPAHRVGRAFRFVPTEVDIWVRSRGADRDTSSTEEDRYRDAVRRLVDQAPPLTAEQADRIASILNVSS